MASDAEVVETISQAPAFKRKWKKPSKHRPSEFLPSDIEYDLMLVCSQAAGDVTKGAEWYESMPLSDVYRWLAVRLAELPPDS